VNTVSIYKILQKLLNGYLKVYKANITTTMAKKPDDITGSIVYHISLFQGRQGHWGKQKITIYICHSTSVLFYKIIIQSRKIYLPVQPPSCALDSVFPNSL